MVEKVLEESAEGLGKRVICLGKVLGDRPIPGIIVYGSDGRGDCSKCAYDPDENRKCSGYKPVSMLLFRVVEKK